MDPILKEKLKEYFNRINTRNAEITGLTKAEKFTLEHNPALRDKINKITIGWCMANKFKFRKTRLANGSVLDVQNEQLQIRKFKHHRWNTVDPMWKYQDIDYPDERINLLVRDVKKMIEDGAEDSEKQRWVDISFPALKIEKMDSWSGEIVEEEMTGLLLDHEKIKTMPDNTEVKLFLDNDYIYEQAQKLIQKAKDESEGRKKEYEAKLVQIDALIDKYKLRDYLVLAVL